MKFSDHRVGRSSKKFKIQKLFRLQKRTPFGVLGKNLTAQDIAQLAYVTPSTARRWIADPARMPQATRELLEFKVLGVVADPAFRGWRVVEGLLWDEVDSSHTPAQIMARGFERQRANALEARLLQDESNGVRDPLRMPRPSPRRRSGP